MKDKDTIENILTDNTNLDMETLEKINDTCYILKDEQKKRILDIIEQKTINKEQTKDIINTTESKDSVKIITYRRNHMKLIISAVACICLLISSGLLGKLSDHNITQKVDPNATTKSTTTTPANTKKTTSNSTLPPETVIETVLETTTTTPIVTTTTPATTTITTTPLETTVSETSATSQIDENDNSNKWINLKEYYLENGAKFDKPFQIPLYEKNNSGADTIINSELNDEQKSLLLKVDVFQRVCEYIFSEVNPQNESDLVTDVQFPRYTQISYDSFIEFTHLFFTDDSMHDNENIHEYIDRWFANDNGQLLNINYFPPTPWLAYIDEIVIEKSTDSYIKFNLIMTSYETSIPEYFLEKYPDKNIAAQKFVEYCQTPKENDLYIKENINIENIDVKGENMLCTYTVTEEMLKTPDGWRFSNYNTWEYLYWLAYKPVDEIYN